MKSFCPWGDFLNEKRQRTIRRHMQNCENNWKEVESSLNNFRIYASILLVNLARSLERVIYYDLQIAKLCNRKNVKRYMMDEPPPRVVVAPKLWMSNKHHKWIISLLLLHSSSISRFIDIVNDFNLKNFPSTARVRAKISNGNVLFIILSTFNFELAHLPSSTTNIQCLSRSTWLHKNAREAMKISKLWLVLCLLQLHSIKYSND